MKLARQREAIMEQERLLAEQQVCICVFVYLCMLVCVFVCACVCICITFIRRAENITDRTALLSAGV